MCVDMETATLFTTGFTIIFLLEHYFGIRPADDSWRGEDGESDSIVTQQYVEEHVEIGIASLQMIIEEKKTVKHLNLTGNFTVYGKETTYEEIARELKTVSISLFII